MERSENSNSDSKNETVTTEIVDGKLVSTIDGWYQVATKDNDGEAHIHTLYKHSTKTRPQPTDIEQHFVRQAPPAEIRATRRKRTSRPDKLAVAFGDAHAPFEDSRCFDLLNQVTIDWQPDEVVILGDMLDLPAQSKFETRKEWVDLTQVAIDGLHTYLSQLRANNPNAKMTWVDGNHDIRFERDIRRNAGELLGIKRANAEHELGVLTLSYLMRLNELEINYIGGYPRADYYLTDNLKAKHGDRIRNGGSTASVIANQEQVSTISGHNHRLELASRTVNHRNGARFIISATAGTFADISGRVPSYSFATDELGQVVTQYENWQQGLLLAEYTPDINQITPIHIQDGSLIYGGRTYKAL
jgi:predicted phosphodiesterase